MEFGILLNGYIPGPGGRADRLHPPCFGDQQPVAARGAPPAAGGAGGQAWGVAVAEPSDPRHDEAFIGALIATYSVAPTTDWARSAA